MRFDNADGPPRSADADATGGAPSRHLRETRRSLRLIANSLGMSVASFYEAADRTTDTPRTQDGDSQALSRDSAELLHAFMALTDPKDRQVCIAFVQKIAAKPAS